MREKERCKEWEKCFSLPCSSAEVNKMYMTLWVSNNKPPISCTLRAFDIRMTQRPHRESRTPLHSCTRASLEAFGRNNCSFQSLLFLMTFLVIAVTFLWLLKQWDTAAQGWLWLHNYYKPVLRLLLQILITPSFLPDLWYVAILKWLNKNIVRQESPLNSGERELSHILRAWAFFMPENEKQITLHVVNSLPSAPDQPHAS